jgi:hypothetical protein
MLPVPPTSKHKMKRAQRCPTGVHVPTEHIKQQPMEMARRRCQRISFCPHPSSGNPSAFTNPMENDSCFSPLSSQNFCWVGWVRLHTSIPKFQTQSHPEVVELGGSVIIRLNYFSKVRASIS